MSVRRKVPSRKAGSRTGSRALGGMTVQHCLTGLQRQAERSRPSWPRGLDRSRTPSGALADLITVIVLRPLLRLHRLPEWAHGVGHGLGASAVLLVFFRSHEKRGYEQVFDTSRGSRLCPPSLVDHGRVRNPRVPWTPGPNDAARSVRASGAVLQRPIFLSIRLAAERATMGSRRLRRMNGVMERPGIAQRPEGLSAAAASRLLPYNGEYVQWVRVVRIY